MVKEAFNKLSDDKKKTIIKCGIAEFSKKSYSEASTDEITKNSGISKGILFHYFGSKKDFYCFCLEQALEKLNAEPTHEPGANDFYEIIFSFMEEKISLCREFPEEMQFVNMAARESNSQVLEHKNAVLVKFMIKAKEKSAQVMKRAVTALNLKNTNTEKIIDAFNLYTGAIINKYLEMYKEKPDMFFQKTDEIKDEIKEYLDYLLYGVVKGDRK
ncbi:MAG: TetR/AcrR family transcriptional regulator [Clostridiaceae bacterium]|nr:TetR/AcrR family transcriptional regulator [Clostridiaceae bacterium]